MTDRSGVMFLWPGRWLLVGRLGANRTHRHVAASLLLGLDGSIGVEADGQWRRTRAALVAPETPQALDPEGGRVLVAHLDPDTDNWLRLAPLLRGRSSVNLELPAKIHESALALTEDPDCETAAALMSALRVPDGPEPRSPDPRVLAVARRLRTELPERADARALAETVGLSASRLTHLFRAETGVTLRRFLLHLKIQQAMLCWRPGMSLSTLAAEAGFHDQPHLARTAREMFDALPSHYITAGSFTLVHCRN